MKRTRAKPVRTRFGVIAAVVLFLVLAFPHVAASQEDPADKPHRRITAPRKDSTARKLALLPVRIVKFPFWLIDRGAYHGLLIIDQHRLIPRIQTYRSRLARLGVTPVFGGAGDGAGLGGGLVLTWKQASLTPSVSIAGSVKGYEDYSAWLHTAGLLPHDVETTMLIRYRSRPEEDFFGLGRNSRRADRTNYDIEQTRVTFEAAAPIHAHAKVSIRAGFVNSNVFAGEDDKFPSTDAFFAGRFIPGLHGGAKLVFAEASYAYDQRIHPGNPTGGWFAHASGAVFEDADGNRFNFWKARFDVQGYRALLGRGGRFGPRSVLAVRLTGEFNDPRKGGVVPFFHMPTLGGSGTLRGFKEFRFFDRHAVVLNVEYRYPIQHILQASVFLDTGEVFGSAPDFDLSDLRASGGVGLHAVLKDHIVMRFDIGFSTEGTQAFLKFRRMF